MALVETATQLRADLVTWLRAQDENLLPKGCSPALGGRTRSKCRPNHIPPPGVSPGGPATAPRPPTAPATSRHRFVGQDSAPVPFTPLAISTGPTAAGRWILASGNSVRYTYV
jgi:hypothetical protein